MKKFLLNVILATMFIMPMGIYAQNAGSLDLTFATNGKFTYDNGYSDLFTCTAIQDDQKIIAAGVSFDAVYTATANVFRFLPDGSIDTDFATNGIFSYSLNNEANIKGCAIRDNGKIVLVGSTTDLVDYRILIIQLNEDGTLDNSFGDNGVVVQKISNLEGYFEDHGLALALMDDGQILVAGRSLNLDYKFVPVVVCFNENGTLNTTFGTGGVASISVDLSDNDFDCIALQDDGKIVASGHVELGLQYYGLLVARFNSNGTLDIDFADGGVFIESFGDVDDEGYGVAINSEGNILVSGFTATASYTYSMLLMQLTTNGDLDMNFGSGGVVYSTVGTYVVGAAVTLQDDNKILVAGASGELPPEGDSKMTVWRYNPDGTIDDSFGVDGIADVNFNAYFDEALGMALQANGYIVIVGKARDAQNENIDFAMARLVNDTQLQAGFYATPNPACAGEIVYFTDNSVGNVNSYEWVFEGGTPSTSTEQNPQIVYNVAGTYDVQLTVTGEDMEQNTLLIENFISAVSSPTQLTIPTGNTEVCNNGENEYTTTGVQGSDNIIWSLSPEIAGEVSVDGMTAIIIWNNNFTGNASLTVLAENSCGEGPVSDALEILVNASPAPVVTGDDLVCKSEVSVYSTTENAGSYYNWEVIGGTITAGEGTSEITVTWGNTPGMAYAIVDESLELGCSGIDTLAVTIDDCMGIDNNLSETGVKAYPNPAYSTLNLEYETSVGETVSISVYNSLGKLVLQNRETASSQRQISTINVEPLSKGMYVVTISTAEKEILKSKFNKN